MWTAVPFLDRPVSMVHECDSSCKVEDVEHVKNVEREQMVTMQYVFKHDWTLLLYCFNACVLHFITILDKPVRIIRTGSI